MKRFIASLVVLFFSMQTSASIISIETDKSALSVGETVNVWVKGTFADFDSFNLAVFFNDTIFEVVTDSLQASSAINVLDFVGFEDIGFVSAVYLSFDTTLNGDQTLFTFSLRAIGSGLSELTLFVDEFYDSLSLQNVDFTAVNNAQVSVSEVPVPAMWALLLMIGTLVVVRRR